MIFMMNSKLMIFDELMIFMMNSFMISPTRVEKIFYVGLHRTFTI